MLVQLKEPESTVVLSPAFSMVQVSIKVSLSRLQ